MLKRAYLAVTRRKNKSIILGIILFIVANLVLSSITVKNATEEAVDYARQSLGGEVSLSTDMDQFRDNMHQMIDEESDGTFTRPDNPDIYLSDVLSIAESDYVIDYSYGFTFNATAVDFDPIETESVATDDFAGGHGFSFEDSGDISIQAINAYALISGVSSGDIELIEGEAFDEANGDDVVISYELALANDLELGDTIEIETLEEEVAKTLTIIGIYDNVSDGDSLGNRWMDPSNTMYVNISTGVDLLSEDDYNDGDYVVSHVNFYLDDPINADAFIEEANTLVSDLEDRGLALDLDDAAYEQMVGPIEGVASSSNSILIVVVVAAVVILSLLIINQIKDRNYEIGVLLALGEKKSKVAFQIFTELILVATIAFVLSFGTSSFISQRIGDNLLENQLTMSEEQSVDTYGRGGGMGMGQFSSVNSVDAIDELEISASLDDYMMLFGIGYLIILISLVLPIAKIMKYEPKTILTRKE